MTAITPLNMITKRAPEAGRIRMGVKTAKAMKAIDTFRFTSVYQDAIERLAEIYGGTAEPWEEPKAKIKKQWQVITTTKQGVRVFLPPESLSVDYELWSGGGRERQCDGEVCTIAGREDFEEVSCICRAKGVAECKPKARINVVLPELDFQGTWRLETGSWNAVHELPGMFDMIQSLASSGKMVDARLNIEPRSQVKNGKTRNFVVPTLTLAHTPLEMLNGEIDVAPKMKALPVPGAVELVAPDEVLEVPNVTEMEAEIKVIADAFDIDEETLIADIYERTQGDLARVQSMINKVNTGSLGISMEDGKVTWEIA